ncbi:unnamed protein product [Aphanomyces euteiches]
MDKKAFKGLHTMLQGPESHADPYEIARGPGYIDPKVPVTKRPLSLYKADRSTSLHLVLPLHTEAIYDVDHGIAYDSKSKGNAAPLKSATPRFPESAKPVPGPGSYHSELFHGAFPTLLKCVTARDVQQEHQAKIQELKNLMGVAPPPTAQPNATPATDHAMPRRPFKKPMYKATPGRRRCVDELDLQNAALACTSPLVARLTPKNAYNGSYAKVMAVTTPRYRQLFSPNNKAHFITDDTPTTADTTTNQNAAGNVPTTAPTETPGPAEPAAETPTLSLTSQVIKQEISLSDAIAPE